MPLVSQKELTPVVYGDYPVKYFRQKAAPGELVFNLHWHDRVELHRVVSGSLELFCGEEHTVLHAGEVSAVSPRLLHHGVAGEEGVVYDVLMFDVSLLKGRASEPWLGALESGRAVFEIRLVVPSVAAAVQRVIDAYTAKDTHPLGMVGLLYGLLGEIYRYGGIREHTSALFEENFGRVISYINENFTGNITSASLSELFGYDEAYFCRKFKRVTGVTAMRYIRILRMEKARLLIAETEIPVSAVAAACGFADVAYFSNCFKQQYGVTPGRLRSEKRSSV